MFKDATPGTMFVHSCNCEGSWGKGIALEFKQRYHGAFQIYSKYCRDYTPEWTIGRALLLLPPESDDPEETDGGVYIGCLFVKKKPGKPKTKREKDTIKEATRTSLLQLVEGIETLVEQDPSVEIHEIRMPKINSGIFQIPWDETVEIIEESRIPAGENLRHLAKIVVYTG